MHGLVLLLSKEYRTQRVFGTMAHMLSKLERMRPR